MSSTPQAHLLPGTPSGRGNFAHRSVVSPFIPKATDAMPDRTWFGLAMSGSYAIAWFRDEDGAIWSPTRKIVAEFTSGLQLQTNRGREALELDLDRLRRSARGAGVSWSADEHGTVHVTSSPLPGSEQFALTLSDETLHWVEGEDLILDGHTMLGAFQWFTPMAGEGGGGFYTSQMYACTATLNGKQHRGMVALEQLYVPQGQYFQNGPYFNGIELAWVFFYTSYTDGSYDVGHLALGAEHWGFAMLANQEGPAAFVADIKADIDLDESDYVRQAVYHVPGSGKWHFEGDPRGRMVDMARARRNLYHGQAGMVRREGDPREVDVACAWVETFPLNGVARAASAGRHSPAT